MGSMRPSTVTCAEVKEKSNLSPLSWIMEESESIKTLSEMCVSHGITRKKNHFLSLNRKN
jgi:hypothetical protein